LTVKRDSLPLEDSQNASHVRHGNGRSLVVLQKPQGQDNRLLPPRTLIMDFTMTHVRFGGSQLHPIGQLTHTRRSDGAPDPDGALKEATRIKIRHYRNIYLNRPDPITYLPLAVETSFRLYDDLTCKLKTS